MLTLFVLALLQDFDGSWKVPDEQTLNPAKCKAGDVKEGLRLAFTAEAGVREFGQTDEKRLEKALQWHQKACEIGKRKPCANAERVQKKLEQARAQKTEPERSAFWCAEALD